MLSLVERFVTLALLVKPWLSSSLEELGTSLSRRMAVVPLEEALVLPLSVASWLPTLLAQILHPPGSDILAATTGL